MTPGVQPTAMFKYACFKSGLDINSFESDDWERLSQLKTTLKRVLEECDNLHYSGDDMIVEPPLAYIESGNHA